MQSDINIEAMHTPIIYHLRFSASNVLIKELFLDLFQSIAHAHFLIEDRRTHKSVET
jgi:hypothetical protein